MKITTTAKEYRSIYNNKRRALKDCNICPCCGCGEVNSFLSMNWYGNRNGFINCFCERTNRYWQVDCFECPNCGARWESEPYPLYPYSEC